MIASLSVPVDIPPTDLTPEQVDDMHWYSLPTFLALAADEHGECRAKLLDHTWLWRLSVDETHHAVAVICRPRAPKT